MEITHIVWAKVSGPSYFTSFKMVFKGSSMHELWSYTSFRMCQILLLKSYSWFDFRVALLKKSGEEDWKNRINKKQEVVKVASPEQKDQPLETEQTNQQKVSSADLTQTAFISVGGIAALLPKHMILLFYYMICDF